MNIDGAVALVTGAGAGIGRATARRLAREGAAVAVNDIDEAAALDSVRVIEKDGGRAVATPADVATDDGVRNIIGDVCARFGRLDILVNNAGILETGTTPREVFEELPSARWLRVLDVNIRGVLLGTQHATAAMRHSGGGVIINVASMAGIGVVAHPSPVYAASKAAIVRFTAALAPLARRLNVRVNCICPDWVDTPMVRRTRAAVSADEWRAMAPSIMTQPEEIADAVVTIAHDDSLAGRVMLCVGPKPWPFMEPTMPPKRS